MKEKKETKTDITQRSDGMWIVDAKLSAVRIGLVFSFRLTGALKAMFSP
jgi:hypothetical protein